MPTYYYPPRLPVSDLSREPTHEERAACRYVSAYRTLARPDGSQGLGKFHVPSRSRTFHDRLPILLPRTVALMLRSALHGDGVSWGDCWSHWQYSTTIVFPHDSFRTFASVIEVHGGPTLSRCDGCQTIVNLDDDDYREVDGCVICHNCVESCGSCDDCGELSRYLTDIGRSSLCDNCRDRNYSFCDQCEEWYHDDYADDHDHSEHCHCEPIAPRFRFLGADVDEEVTLELPAGTIDETGLRLISRYLYDNNLPPYLAYEIGNEWQGKRGTYTRRLSAAAHKAEKKITPEVLTHIGNLARSNCSVDPKSYIATFTRDTKGSAEEFGNSDSCWFGSGEYGKSRCALRSWGGFAFRVWGHREVRGRCWVQPLKGERGELVPTQSIDGADAFMTYNGYGDLEGYVPARLIAQSLGWTYRKIGYVADAMYVNGSTGYLVAQQAICDANTQVSIYLNRHDVVRDCEVHHVA